MSSAASKTKIIEGDGTIKVAVRVRPETKKEQTSQAARIVVRTVNENVVVFDPADPDPRTGAPTIARRGMGGLNRGNKDMKMAFDFVFGPECNNEDVYRHTTKELLESLLSGYNCSVLAYGATGAGKTYTMVGNQQQPGVMYHTMGELFHRVKAIQKDKNCTVTISYLEIYNETIKDLLSPGKCLPLREDPKLGIKVAGLSNRKPETAEELLTLLKFGNQNRTQHPTDANAESSRSHAVFQVVVQIKDKTANLRTEVRTGKLCMVDLAGSERACVSTNRGQRAQEGANINRSLLALGNLITALAIRKGDNFISYRGSKLTRLLKDSLGGNCQSIMIALVSPSNLAYEETYNTLKYASRTKEIRTNLKKNVFNVDVHVAQYKIIVKDLRDEVEQLKAQLRQQEERASTQIMLSDEDKYLRIRQTLHAVFGERLAVRQEQLAMESREKRLLFEVECQEKALATLRSMHPPLHPAVEEEVQSNIAAKRTQVEELAKEKEDVAARLRENSITLERLQEDARLCHGDPNTLPGVIAECIQGYNLEVNLADAQLHIQHLQSIMRGLEHHTHFSDRLTDYLQQRWQRQEELLRQTGVAEAEGAVVEVSELQDMWKLVHDFPPLDVNASSVHRLADLPTLSFTTQHGVVSIREKTSAPVLPALPCAMKEEETAPALLVLSASTCNPVPVSDFSPTPNSLLVPTVVPPPAIETPQAPSCAVEPAPTTETAVVQQLPQTVAKPGRLLEKCLIKTLPRDSPTRPKKPQTSNVDSCVVLRSVLVSPKPGSQIRSGGASSGGHSLTPSRSGRTAVSGPSLGVVPGASVEASFEETADTTSPEVDLRGLEQVALSQSQRLASRSVWDVLSHPASAMTQAKTLEDIKEESENTGHFSNNGSFSLPQVVQNTSSNQSPGLHETFTLDPDACSPLLADSLPSVDGRLKAQGPRREAVPKSAISLPGPARVMVPGSSSAKKRCLSVITPQGCPGSTPGRKGSPSEQRVSKAARSITFSDEVKTPGKAGSSRADTLNTPTPLRQPLRVLNHNTPSSPACPQRLSTKPNAGESPSLFPFSLPKRIPTPKRSASSSAKCSRVVATLSRLSRGARRQLRKRKASPSFDRDSTSPKVARPSYMQMTKAALHRKESKDDCSLLTAQRVPAKASNRSLVRSQSMPRLKRGWQL